MVEAEPLGRNRGFKVPTYINRKQISSPIMRFVLKKKPTIPSFHSQTKHTTKSTSFEFLPLVIVGTHAKKCRPV